MAFKILEMVMESVSAAPGTGNILLAGALFEYTTVSSQLADGDTTYLIATDVQNNRREHFLGTYVSATNSIVRTTTFRTFDNGTYSESGVAINLGANTVISGAIISDILSTSGAANAISLSDSIGRHFFTRVICNQIAGSIDPAGGMRLRSTWDATKGLIYFGSSAYDETNNYMGIGTTTPGYTMDIRGSLSARSDTDNNYASIRGGTAKSAGFYFLEDANARYLLYQDGYSNFRIYNFGTTTNMFTMDYSGNVSIGNMNPTTNPLVVNRSADGVIVDFASGGVVQGNVSIAGATTSYNAFAGSHYTHLRTAEEPPVGGIVISSGDIIPSATVVTKQIEVTKAEALMWVPKTQVVTITPTWVEDEIDELEDYYAWENDTRVIKQRRKKVKSNINKIQLKAGIELNDKTGEFYKLKPSYVKIHETYYRIVKELVPQPGKEYFPYIDGTTIAQDPRVYGVWHGKMKDNSEGMAFGIDSEPVYLVTQVGLFTVRVTDTNGNIYNGDWITTSPRKYEAQKQDGTEKHSYTIAKALVDVDWAREQVDPVLGYKWKLIPCIF